jgi:arabinofuranosyltransferase
MTSPPPAPSNESVSHATPRERLALGGLAATIFFLSIVTYNHLNEDAFITFRYVQNFAAGRGLSFNPDGERVEGYSNLLWVWALTPWEWAGVRLHVAARLMSTALFAAAALAGFGVARRFQRDDDPRWLLWWLPVALALDPTLHYFDDNGLETVPYMAFLGLAMFRAGTGRAWWCGAFASLAALTRPEGAALVLSLAPAVAWGAVQGAPRGEGRRAAAAALAKAFGPPTACAVAQLAFRYATYGEWVPNTLIAKTKADISDSITGWTVIPAFVASRSFVPAIGAIGVLSALRWRELRPMALAVGGMAGAALAINLAATRSIHINFRYMAPLAIPSVAGCWLLLAASRRDLREGAMSPRRLKLRRRTLALAAGLFLFLVPTLLYRQPYNRGWRWLRGNQDHPGSRFGVRLLRAETWNLPERFSWYLSDPVILHAEAGRWARANLPADATIGIDQAGKLCYFAHPEQTFIDLLGLNDGRIARYGFSMDYLKERNPEYLLLQAYSGDDFFAPELRYEPVASHLRDGDLEGAGGYRKRWILQSRCGAYQPWTFVCYVRRDLDDGCPTQLIELGVEEEEFRRLWQLF